MTMIKVAFNHHDFLFAVEGFAKGSHLRQHVWRSVEYHSIPQMSVDDIDFLWFFMRRDFYNHYFLHDGNTTRTAFGYYDFMHVLAALHRGNRYTVTLKSNSDGHPTQYLCYRFHGKYRPLHAYRYSESQKCKCLCSSVEPFDLFIPDENIKVIVKKNLPENRYVTEECEVWWNNLGLYDDFMQRIK